MSAGTIVFAIIVLHLLVGFGYLFYKLSGKPRSANSRKEVQ
ncbi:MAG: hypothetical protein U0X40_03065 [Ferruginibacter sp.]